MGQQLFHKIKMEILQPKQTNSENHHLFQIHSYLLHISEMMEYKKYLGFKFKRFFLSIFRTIVCNHCDTFKNPNPNLEYLAIFNYFQTKVPMQDNFELFLFVA